MEALLGLLGPEYTMHIIVQSSLVAEFILAGAVFALPLRRRRRFLSRLMLGGLVVLLSVAALVVLRVKLPNLAAKLLVGFLRSGVMLPVLFICFDEDWTNIALTWCAGVAAVEVGARVFSLLLTIAGVDDTRSNSFLGSIPHDRIWDWVIQFAVVLLVYVVLYLIFGRQERAEPGKKDRARIAVLALVSVAEMSLLGNLTSEFQGEDAGLYAICQLYGVAASLLVLTLRSGLLFQSRYQQELAVMEQVIQEERRQYQTSKKNIEIINMRCHDLKHQLANLAGRLTDREIQELQEAISIYDSSVKTGSEVLDVLLYESQLVCRKEDIRLTCMADGGCLGFMRTRHTYSLLNNALSNALEAVRQVEDPEKRVISLTVGRVDGNVEIEVTNYFSGPRNLAEGTTKKDRDHHGFGMMSMRYVAEQYGGSLESSLSGEVFTLHMRIPIPAAS